MSEAEPPLACVPKAPAMRILCLLNSYAHPDAPPCAEEYREPDQPPAFQFDKRGLNRAAAMCGLAHEAQKKGRAGPSKRRHPAPSLPHDLRHCRGELKTVLAWMTRRREGLA